MARRRTRYKTLRQLDEQINRVRKEGERRGDLIYGPQDKLPVYYDPHTLWDRERRAGKAYHDYATRIINHFLGKDHYWYITQRDLEPFYDTPVSSRIYMGLGNG